MVAAAAQLLTRAPANLAGVEALRSKPPLNSSGEPAPILEDAVAPSRQREPARPGRPRIPPATESSCRAGTTSSAASRSYGVAAGQPQWPQHACLSAQQSRRLRISQRAESPALLAEARLYSRGLLDYALIEHSRRAFVDARIERRP